MGLIGFVALARTTFDLALATEMAERAFISIQHGGLPLLGSANLLTDVSGLRQATEGWAEQPLDAVVVFQATFADSSLLTWLAEDLAAPLVLWAVPEAPSGGRLRLNSLCGIHLGAHALTLRRKHYACCYAQPEASEAVARIRIQAEAGRALRQLRTARLGVLGDHPDGMDTSHLDAPLVWERLGVEVVTVGLESVLESARRVDSSQVDRTFQQLDEQLENLRDLDLVQVRGTLGVYLALRELAERLSLDGLAVRCWPEFFTELGCAACGALSILTNEGRPCSCEADANGTVTQLILSWLSEDVAYGTDLVSVDVESNTAVLWHCGLAPLGMADPTVKPRAALHSNRGVPLVMEFPLKPGRVTLARLSRASGRLQMVVGGGEMISAKPSFSGTSGVLRFDRDVSQVLDTLLGLGLEHHLSITYGDHRQSLCRLAEWLELPIVELS